MSGNDEGVRNSGAPGYHDAVAAMLALAGLEVEQFVPARRYAGGFCYVVAVTPGERVCSAHIRACISTVGKVQRVRFDVDRNLYIAAFEIERP